MFVWPEQYEAVIEALNKMYDRLYASHVPPGGVEFVHVKISIRTCVKIVGHCASNTSRGNGEGASALHFRSTEYCLRGFDVMVHETNLVDTGFGLRSM